MEVNILYAILTGIFINIILNIISIIYIKNRLNIINFLSKKHHKDYLKPDTKPEFVNPVYIKENVKENIKDTNNKSGVIITDNKNILYNNTNNKNIPLPNNNKKKKKVIKKVY